MRKVLAISGGVDSMAMLDMLQHQDIVIAHFDHGTRPSSKDDAEFVREYTKTHRLPFTLGTSELGEGVSEEVARQARYGFLEEACAANGCDEIYTAHHLDDLVESVAINLLRGTGWRGLAVMDTPGIRRPFLEPELLPDNVYGLAPFDKRALIKYAADAELTFRQDPTNNEDEYLRNRVRRKLQEFEKKYELYKLWQDQKRIKLEIDEIVKELLPENGTPWQREWFRDLDEKVALELLRAGTMRAGISATRPQLENFRQAILEYAPGKAFNLPQDKLIVFTKTTFVL